jgi:protein-S-isoprenylcysteine O-methyltransferase Ste14
MRLFVKMVTYLRQNRSSVIAARDRVYQQTVAFREVRWLTFVGKHGADAKNMATNSDQTRPREPTDRRRLVISAGSSLLIFVLCLFLPAGTLAWPKGWLFFSVTVAASILITIYLHRVNPDVVAARVNRHEGTKGWDRVLLGLFLPTLVSILPVAAMDDGRFYWFPLPWWVCVIGYVLLIAGILGVTWAESVNRFFEPTVRIQADRGHTVIDFGPYAIVRHPGYVSGFLVFIGTPLSLGSLWALIPAVMACLLLIVRTILEDRTLRTGLNGYGEYAQRVRYRLIPGVW